VTNVSHQRTSRVIVAGGAAQAAHAPLLEVAVTAAAAAGAHNAAFPERSARPRPTRVKSREAIATRGTRREAGGASRQTDVPLQMLAS